MKKLDSAPEQTKELRAATLGASSVAASLGLSQYAQSTPLSDWMRRQPDYEPEPPTIAMLMGHATEPINRDKYATKLPQGWEVMIPEQQAHPEHSWLTCHPDGFVLDEFGEVRWGFEAKFTSVQHYKTDYPVDWVVQCQMSMAICGLDRWDLSILVPGAVDVVVHTMERDRDYGARLIERAREYWQTHVIGGERPPAHAVDLALLASLPHASHALIDADEETAKIAQAHREITHRIADLEADAAALQLEIAERIGESAGICGEFGKVYFKAGTRTTTDWRNIALMYEPPTDLVKAHTHQKQTKRSFRTFYKKRGEDEQGATG